MPDLKVSRGMYTMNIIQYFIITIKVGHHSHYTDPQYKHNYLIHNLLISTNLNNNNIKPTHIFFQKMLPQLLLTLSILSLIQSKHTRTYSAPITSQKNIKWQPESLTYFQNDTLLKVCPQQNVMKAKYQCFVYKVDQVQQAVDAQIQKLQGLFVPSLCVKSRMDKFVPKDSLPQPQGGFIFVYYQCEVKKK